MATVVWGAGSGAGSDGLWSTAANWTGNTKPAAGDAVIFNAVGSSYACSLDEHSAYTLASVTLETAYGNTLTCTDRALYADNVDVESGCTLTGSGSGAVQMVTSGGTLSNAGTYTPISTVLSRAITVTAGTYGGTFTCKQLDGGTNRTLTLTGNITFTGAVTYQNLKANRIYTIAATGTITHEGSATFVVNNTNATLVVNGTNPSWIFEGNVTLTETVGTLTWTKGTGTITLSGPNYQNIDFLGKSIEDFIVNKSAGVVKFTGNMNPRSFSHLKGSIRPNGRTINVDNDCDWAEDATFAAANADTMNGCTWTVGGNFTCNGQRLNATTEWFLQVTGIAEASGLGKVDWSNAVGFTTINAPTWYGDNNTNWTLGTAPVDPPLPAGSYIFPVTKLRNDALAGTRLDPTDPLNDRLMGLWDFNYGDNVNVFDQSAYGNHAEWSGSSTNHYVLGPPRLGGLAGKFVSSNGDYVQDASVSGVTLGNYVAISMWIYLSSISDIVYIYDFQSDGSRYYFLTDDTGTTWRCRFNDMADTNLQPGFVIGEWQHFIVQYSSSGTSNLLTLFRNGKLENQYSDTAMSPATLSDITIGAKFDGDTPMDGSIADFRIYNKVFTAAEARDIYLNGPQYKSNFKSTGYIETGAPPVISPTPWHLFNTSM